MKYITRTACALALGVALTACGQASDPKPTTGQQPAQQTADAAQGKSYFPEFEASLLEPITISDQKSPTAIEDLQKYTGVMEKLEPQIIQTTNKLMQEARRQGKEPSAEFKQELQQWSDMYGQLVQTLNGLDLKDAEVKTMAERHAKLMQKQRDIAMTAISEAIPLESASQQVQQEFRKQSAEQRQKLEQAMGTLQGAMQKLAAKYSN